MKADKLARFDWVFYLPPKEAAGEVIDSLLPEMLKKQKMGFFKRATVRSSLVVFAPAVRKAIESARKSMLFMTVLHARGGHSEDDVRALTRAYVRVLMPDFKFNDFSTQERAITAVQDQLAANAEYAKNPYVSPSRLTTFDLAAYVPFAGEYGPPDGPARRFASTAAGFTWQYREAKPRPMFPAGERLLVSEDGRMTLRFQVDDAGAVTGVEERWHRGGRTLPRMPAATREPVKARESRRGAAGNR